uniref:Reverse transcriptase domain-containing protein n=1 Tax=Tanacetum cinerariifolium TaxID=118510 RepID=A0A6L2LR87_TANCI|nr:reverse transcriptase domain-containing protein [Tanacetum cinerariifolium]
MQIRQAYYATNEESSDSSSSSTIPPPPALICPLRKKVRASRAPIAPPPVLPLPSVLETELQEARTQIAGFQREQMRHDDEVVLTRVRISTLEVTMALLPPGFLEPLYPGIMNMINAQDIEHMIPPTPPKDIEPPVGSPIPSSSSLSVGSSSPVRSTTPPPDYSFDESIFAELDNSLWIILRPLGSEPVCDELNEMAPKRKLTSAAPTMTQAAIRKLVADSVATALEAQATTMANTINANRNARESETHVAKKCSYKEFISCNPFYFKANWNRGSLQDHLVQIEEALNKEVLSSNRVLCPTMVPNAEKHMEVFIGGLPRSIKRNVTTSKRQTLEEATTIA